MTSPVATELYYRFACSQFAVSGSVESNVDYETGLPITEATSEITSKVMADPRREALVRFPRHQGSANHNVSFKLLDDGRLASASGSEAGILADAITAAISVIGFVGGIVQAIAAPAKLPVPTIRPLQAPPAPPTPRKRWEGEKAGDAELLKNSLAALKELHATVISESAAMATTANPAATYRKLIGLRAAIAAVEEMVAAIEARREAWLNTNYQTLSTHTFTLPTDEAFSFETEMTSPPSTIEANFLKDVAEPGDMLSSLGVAIVEITPEAEADIWTTEDAATLAVLKDDVDSGEQPRGVFFRIPRAAKFAIYTATAWDDDGRVKTLQLSRVERCWALDRYSRLGSVPFEGEGDVSASVVFSAAGTPESVVVSGKSQLSAVLQALGGAPEKLSASLGHAKTAVEAWNALSMSRVDRETAALEARKKQLEAVVAGRDLESDAMHRETLKTLKARLERLKTEKAIGEATAPPKVPSEQSRHDAERTQELDRLRVELAIAKAEAALSSFNDGK